MNLKETGKTIFITAAAAGSALAVLSTSVNAAAPVTYYTVTPGTTGNGTITPSAPQTVEKNNPVTFTLDPNDHNHLIDVTGDCKAGTTTDNDNDTWDYTIDKVNKDCTLTANFGIDQYSLTVTSEGTGSGTVSSSPAGIDCGADCTQEFDYGSEVTLTALADSHNTFMGWSGEGCTGTDECTVTMDQIRQVTAIFDFDQFNLTVTTEGTGSGTVSSSPAGIDCGADCAQEFDYGSEVTLTALANNSCTFVGWNDEGCTGTDECTVTMEQDRQITAIFKAFPWPMFQQAIQGKTQD